MTVAVSCYDLTSRFPRDELCGLTSQVRRAAVSIAANIAEGYGRDQTGNYIQFLRVSMGSVRELETLLLLSKRVAATTESAKVDTLIGCRTEVSKMLRALIRSLESSRASQT
jgi:four helix bundle protein